MEENINREDRKAWRRRQKREAKINKSECFELIESLTDIIERLLNSLLNSQRVRQVLTLNFNNNKTIIMSFSLAANQKAPIKLSLIDSDTGQVVTATFTGETETSDNPAAATADPVNGLVSVAPGTGNLTSVASWTYTDKNTGQPVNVTLTTVTPFEVTAVVSAEKVSQVVTLGPAVAQ